MWYPYARRLRFFPENLQVTEKGSVPSFDAFPLSFLLFPDPL